MQISQLEPQDTSIVLKLFGALFYYQPKDYPAANLNTLLSNTDTPIEALNDSYAASKTRAKRHCKWSTIACLLVLVRCQRHLGDRLI